ncbi:MAG: integral rane protease transrane protein [Frankiales bacterium]|nr:integral rane protease transrane protein [Frankiales bacterium]
MKPAALLLAALVTAAVVTAWVTAPFPVLAGAHPQVDVLRDFTSAQLAREEAYHHALRLPAYLSLALGLVVAGGLGLTRLGARLVSALPGHWTVQAALGTTALLALPRLAVLPLDVRTEQVLRQYGLSTQTWGPWAVDQLRGLAITAGTTALVVLVLLALARAMPKRWWAAGAAATAALVMLGSFLYPVVVEPAFNNFAPMPAGQLRSDLLAMAARDDVAVKDVLVADASRRTTSLNAYVSGYGSSRRIVVYDTLLRQSTPRQVELVVAHELGHAKRQDVLHGTVIGALLGAAAICGLFLLLSSRRVLQRVGADGAGDPRVLALVLFLGVLGPLLVSPLTNLVSRHVEARADLHALELTGDVSTFVSGEQRLSTVNLSELSPSPVVYALFFTHPSGPERIALAREYQRLHQR